MPILNYTTKISVSKTVAEITDALCRAGVRKIIHDMDDDGIVTAVTFWLVSEAGIQCFRLPCNWEGVLKALERDRAVARSLCNKAQALRVGWRIIKDKVEADLAVIEAGLFTMPQIFLAQAVSENGEQTLYELYTENKIKQLQ